MCFYSSTPCRHYIFPTHKEYCLLPLDQLWFTEHPPETSIIFQPHCRDQGSQHRAPYHTLSMAHLLNRFSLIPQAKTALPATSTTLTYNAALVAWP